MGAVPDMPYDYVNFADESISDNVLKEQLIELIKQRKYLESYDYCDGFDNHVEDVMPAIQM